MSEVCVVGVGALLYICTHFVTEYWGVSHLYAICHDLQIVVELVLLPREAAIG